MKKNLIIALAAFFVGSSAIAQIDRTQAPKPQPNPEIKINIPDVVTADNGLKVIVVENHKLPKVSFQLFVDYPTVPEGDKVGKSDIFGQLLSSGTTITPKNEFDAKIDYMGARVSTSARGFFASSLKKHTPNLLALLSEMITKPAFPQEEFDRIVKANISALEQEKSSPDAMASNVAGVVNYGAEHPYGEITTEASLSNLTIDDIKNHYKENFIPNMAYLVIVGDVTQEEAKEYVNKYFSVWEKGTPTAVKTFDVVESKGNNVYFVDKPGAVQSRITITHNMQLKPGHEDVIKLRVLNQVLGGGSFSARLMSNLREDKAYTYGCYSRISQDKLIGSFSAGGNFRNEVTDSAIVQIIMEIEKIAETGVTAKELELVKNSMTGAFARSLEQPETMARFALNTVRYNLPKDYYTNYLKDLEKITQAELLAVAKKYLRPNNLNIIVVGNEEIAGTIEKFDNTGGMELKDSQGKEKINLKAVPDGITAEAVIQNFIYKSFSVNNKVDYDKIMKKVGYVTKVYSAHVEAFGADIYMTQYSGKPNKTASILKMNAGGQKATMQKEYFNGELGGTFVMGTGSTKYEGDELQEKKDGAFLFSQANYYSTDFYNVEMMGIDEVEGEEYFKIKVNKKEKEDFVYEYYSVKTGWLVIEETFTTDDEGNSVTGSAKYEDFKEIKKGIMFPHKMIINNAGQLIEFNLGEVKIKKKPKSTAFVGQF
ncbi:MAG: zinc protease [Arenicella sp.]|jgi:zinc protease